MTNSLRLVITVSIGLVLGRFSSPLVGLLIVAASLLVALVLRVIAQERAQPTSGISRLALGLGVGTLAGRLMSWFGLIGGVVALVLLLIVFVAVGGDMF